MEDSDNGLPWLPWGDKREFDLGAEAAAGVIGVFTVQSCQTCQSGGYSYHANGKGLNRRQGLIVISDSQGPDISVLNSSLVG